MRILHVINRYGWSGGAENQLSKNLAYFRDPDLDHRVVALYDQHEAASDRGTVDVDIQYLFDEADTPGFATRYRSLIKAVTDAEPDLIHCTLNESARASRLVGKRLGIPVLESLVNISHEDIRAVDNPSVRSWKLAAHRFVDSLTIDLVSHFHALTNAVASSWMSNLGIEEERISVIPRGIDLSEFDPPTLKSEAASVREELGIDEDAQVLINTARQEPQKGQRYLIEALPGILESFPRTRLLLVGRRGNSTAQLNSLIGQLGLQSSVIRLGLRDDVPRLMAAADVFVFPSVYEGMGVALLEAMAVGVPCVVSDAPALEEITRPSGAALIAEARNPQALRDAVLEILSDRVLSQELARRGRKTVESNYRIEDSAGRLESLYRTIATTV